MASTNDNTIELLHAVAPFDESRTHDLLVFLRHKGSPWIDDIRQRVRGELPNSEDHFFLAMVGDRLAGHVWYTVTKSNPRLGVIGHIYTHPDYRRRGIARQLIEMAMRAFHKRGGKVMQLFTATSYSIPLYEQFGFELLFGQPVFYDRDCYMRSPHQSCRIVSEWLTTDHVTMRPLAPGDLPQYCLLYNIQYEHLLKDRAQQIGCGVEAELTFIQSSLAMRQNRAACIVVDNGQTLLGAASLCCSTFPHQSHIAVFDLYTLPQAESHAQQLANECLQARAALGSEFIYAIAVDPAKKELFGRLGFVPRASLPNHFRIGNQFHDCELFELPGEGISNGNECPC